MLGIHRGTSGHPHPSLRSAVVASLALVLMALAAGVSGPMARPLRDRARASIRASASRQDDRRVALSAAAGEETSALSAEPARASAGLLSPELGDSLWIFPLSPSVVADTTESMSLSAPDVFAWVRRPLQGPTSGRAPPAL